MADVPISNALIDSAQFVIQTAAPATTDPGNVRLFRSTDGWAEKIESGGVQLIGGGLLLSRVEVTSAQISTLDTVPVQVTPTPAGDKTLIPVSIFVVYKFGTVQYTTADTSNFIDMIYGTPHGISPIDGILSVRFSMTDPYDTSAQLKINDSIWPNSGKIGKALYATMDSPVLDGDGSLIFHTFYAIV